MLGAFQGDDDQRTPEAKAQDDITNFANSERAGFSDAEVVWQAQVEGAPKRGVKVPPAQQAVAATNGKARAPF